MDKPGIESSSKLRLPWKLIAGAGVIGAGLLALSQCDNQESGQPQTAGDITPVDPSKPYYQIIKDTRMRADVNGDYMPDLWIKEGSCVQGVVDSAGAQEKARNRYRVQAQDETGTVKEGYIFAGNIGMQHLDPRVEGFSCKAVFAASSNVNNPPPAVKTFVATETANIRDDSENDADILGTLSKGSCVTLADRSGRWMQVGIATPETAPNPARYLWVREQSFQQSAIKPENCVATITMGARAGVTPRP